MSVDVQWHVKTFTIEKPQENVCFTFKMSKKFESEATLATVKTWTCTPLLLYRVVYKIGSNIPDY